MFTIQTDRQAEIMRKLLDLYYPKRSAKDPLRVIDVTWGSGSMWWDVLENPCTCCNTTHIKLTKCDAFPPFEKWELEVARRREMIKDAIEAKNPLVETMQKDLEKILKKKPPESDRDVLKRNLLTDDYSDLGKHALCVFDPPCLIGKRTGFDYKHKDQVRMGSSHVISDALQGPRSWGATQIEKFTNNPTVADFDARVIALNKKAPTVLENGGRLLCKIFEPREKKRVLKLGDHCKALLTNFEFEDEVIYLRQGATTFKLKGHPQNLHGLWMSFTLKVRKHA